MFLVPVYVSRCEMNRDYLRDEHSLQDCDFILEGALSHGLGPVLHRDPDQVLSARVAGSPALERWGWVMPELHLSASLHLYLLSRASS